MTAQDRLAFNAALVQYDSGQPDQADAVLIRLAAAYPKDAKVQGAAGMSLLESDRVAEGVAYLERSLRLNPGNPGLAKNLALAELKIGRVHEARRRLESMMALEQGDFEIWFALAQARNLDGEKAAALVAYQRAGAVASARNSAALFEFFYDWGAALLEAGQPKTAVAVLEKIPGGEKNAQVLGLRGEAKERDSQYESALGDFRRAAELDGSAGNVQAYGEELLRHQAFAGATTIFAYGVKQYPENAKLRQDLGVAYFGNNDFAKAGDVFGGLLAEHPDDAVTADLLGRACSALATTSSNACAQLPVFARAHPANAPASLYAGIAMLQHAGAEDAARARAYQGAGELLQAALKADPGLAAAWYQMGVLQQARSEWAPSAVSLERAVALAPEMAQAHYRLSRAYAHLGRADAAKEQLALQQTSVDRQKQVDAARQAKEVIFTSATQ